MKILKSIHKKYSDECTIDELKQKRKYARRSAWICGLMGYGIMCVALPVYFISFLVGVTVLVLAFGLVAFLIGMSWKQDEGECTTRIMIKQILDGDIKK